MTQQQKEELKKKWIRFYFNSLHTPEGYADWWLNKFDKLIQEKVEKIKEEKNILMLGKDDTGAELYRANTGDKYKAEGLDIAITILKE